MSADTVSRAADATAPEEADGSWRSPAQLWCGPTGPSEITVHCRPSLLCAVRVFPDPTGDRGAFTTYPHPLRARQLSSPGWLSASVWLHNTDHAKEVVRTSGTDFNGPRCSLVCISSALGCCIYTRWETDAITSSKTQKYHCPGFSWNSLFSPS